MVMLSRLFPSMLLAFTSWLKSSNSLPGILSHVVFGGSRRYTWADENCTGLERRCLSVLLLLLFSPPTDALAMPLAPPLCSPYRHGTKCPPNPHAAANLHSRPYRVPCRLPPAALRPTKRRTRPSCRGLCRAAGALATTNRWEPVVFVSISITTTTITSSMLLNTGRYTLDFIFLSSPPHALPMVLPHS